MSDDIAPEQARSALDAVEGARRAVGEEVGLPRGYWWAMAAGWLVLGVLGDVGPVWLASVATLAFGAGHSVFATRLLSGRRRTGGLRVSADVAGRRTPLIVIGMLLALVALTIAAALGLDADGTGHPSVWAAVMAALVIGFGGPEILRVLRRWAHA
ncbi:hypothetical protein SRB5_02730 [Streptomyces sp. RB5]|uniref:Uncharacterized protein n=1 Tax=Streptomyces smaragdinus TaxID=2585196 RepID=A0A7K0C9U7_9ACTN|nr:hypothetical protein [Streptomyces smaragdinus]MQY10166.1 hypothetical protein [Streptomyces smaragdinus]